MNIRYMKLLTEYCYKFVKWRSSVVAFGYDVCATIADQPSEVIVSTIFMPASTSAFSTS